MITYVVGDLFTSPAKVLVNTVNTVGVMGKGIARDFKRIYPEMFEQYQEYCENGMLDIGKLWLYKTPHKWILNFPTKRHWRNKSIIEYIEAGLQKFVDSYDSKGIESVSFPMLGCGNGGLDWKTQSQPIMESYLQNLPIDVFIHLHQPAARFVPEHRKIREIEKWLRGEPHHLPFVEFWEDLMVLTRRQETFYTRIKRFPYSIHIDENNKSLLINIDSKELIIGNQALKDFWQLVRSSGYCIANEFPSGLSHYADYLIPILDEISYIQFVNLSRHHRVTLDDLGIQLTPGSKVFASPSYELIKPKSA